MNTKPEAMPQSVEVFDTTLRDGMQVEGVSATVDDKLRIAEQLDYLGVHYIEGGWPGANPKDIEFFARAATELNLTTSTVVAFGSTMVKEMPVTMGMSSYLSGESFREELGYDSIEPDDAISGIMQG